MIFARISEREFAVSEFGEWDDLMFGMWYFFLLWFVGVCGPAVVIGRAHVHVSGVFARSRSIRRHTAAPTLARAGCGSIDILQGLIFDVRIGVGRKSPDFAD